MSLADIPTALEALRRGEPIIVADDESRENEGDVILAAELAGAEQIAWMVRNTSGFLCAPMTNEIADRLDLPVMVGDNRDPLGTNYTVSVDAADRRSTGISASERAHTVRVLAAADSTPASLNRPGHVLPLRAAEGGVRERGGHTEATVELLTLAGMTPVGVIGEVVADDGEMMRLPGLLELGEREGIPVTTIDRLVRHLEEREGADAAAARDGATSLGDAPPRGSAASPDETVSAPHSAASAAGLAPTRSSAPAHAPEIARVIFEVETTVPTRYGPFRVRSYRDRMTGADHVAIVAGERLRPNPLVRVHSECLTGEVFGSLKCECGPQLDAALQAIQVDGGVVVYLRGHEGRGIGLINKLRAYALQERGLDTFDANAALGLPIDARDYGAAAAILDDLGVESVRLLTNNPEKVRSLAEHGIAVSERVPLVVGVGPFNSDYLSTKRDRMGHTFAIDDLPASPLPESGDEPHAVRAVEERVACGGGS